MDIYNFPAQDSFSILLIWNSARVFLGEPSHLPLWLVGEPLEEIVRLERPGLHSWGVCGYWLDPRQGRQSLPQRLLGFWQLPHSTLQLSQVNTLVQLTPCHKVALDLWQPARGKRLHLGMQRWPSSRVEPRWGSGGDCWCLLKQYSRSSLDF